MAKQAAYYHPINDLSSTMIRTLTTYSQIPSSKVLRHVQEVRDRAFDVYPWPCLGIGSFLYPILPSHLIYSNILDRLKTCDQNFLDAGCGLGQELRFLAAEGVATKKLYGLDMQPEFVQYGNELFRDEGTFEGQIVLADILSDAKEEKSKVDVLKERMDIILAHYFLHVFNREDMYRAARRLAEFMRPKRGSLVLGTQIAVRAPARESPTVLMKDFIWFHCVDSFKEMWRDIGADLGIDWNRLDVEDVELPDSVLQAGQWPVEDMRSIRFLIERA